MQADLIGRGMSRRSLLRSAAMTGALQALRPEAATARELTNRVPGPPAPLKISIFSKHLHWLSIPEAAAVAAAMGFDAMDLTVRADGHVSPERVTTDLPVAVDAIRKAGLDVSMITTDITPETMGTAGAVLSTASKLGIHHYRWGGLKYNSTEPIAEQLEALRPKMRALAELNRRIGVCGMYHTHSGAGLIGACIWDVWIMFRDLDPQWMGINYDIGHATIEGGYGGWIATAKLTKDYMRGIAIKDFLWHRNSKETMQPDTYDKGLNVEGAFVPQWCAIDAGMVRFESFFEIVKTNGFAGPVQLHIEYPLGGAENGKRRLTLSREVVVDSIRADLRALRGHMSKLGLVA